MAAPRRNFSLGNGTSIFSTLLGDPNYLSVTQTVNWNAPGASANGFFETFGGSGGLRQGQFSLTSITESSAVPEPATLSLVGLCVAAVGFARRRKVA